MSTSAPPTSWDKDWKMRNLGMMGEAAKNRFWRRRKKVRKRGRTKNSTRTKDLLLHKEDSRGSVEEEEEEMDDFIKVKQ